jgi:hypothetical protein
MTTGRIVIGGVDKDAAFTIGRRIALRARHVVRDALDSSGECDASVDVKFQPEGGPIVSAAVRTSDPTLDVAVLDLRDDVDNWVKCGRAIRGIKWKIDARPRDSDPALTGTITDPRRPLRNAAGFDAELLQLLVEQNVGDFQGYSGSSVCVNYIRQEMATTEASSLASLSNRQDGGPHLQQAADR